MAASGYHTALQSLHEEGRDLLRGAAGGLIFGTPLLFTMEMWFQGTSFSPPHLLGMLAFAAFVNICFSYASGLRAHNTDHSLLGAVADGITAMALGVIVAVLVLALIGMLDPAEGRDSMIGKIVIEAAAVSIGVTFTNRKFPRGRKTRSRQYEELENAPLTREQKQARLDFYNLAAVLGGAVIFSFNIAPTEEILMIANGLSAPQLLLIVLAQLGVCYVILYASQFKESKVFKKTWMQAPAAEIVMTVALSLLVAAVLLLLVGHTSAMHSADGFIAAVVTLGFPAVIGGAAGKLVV